MWKPVLKYQKGLKLYPDPMNPNIKLTRQQLLAKYSGNGSPNYSYAVHKNRYYNSAKGKTNYNQMIELGFIPEEDKEFGYIYHLNTKPRSELEADVPSYNRNDQLYISKSLKNGDFIKWCAEAANRLNYNLGKPTVGDAWTRKGVYGDSVVWLRPDNWKYKENRRKFRTDLFESGDIVDLYNPISEYSYEAAVGGRGNSHTGTIVKNPETLEVFLVHNMGGDIESIPLRDYMDREEDLGILGVKVTRVSRPFNRPKNNLSRSAILKPTKQTYKINWKPKIIKW